MKFSQRNALIHKLNAWFSLAVNYLLSSIFWSFSNNDYSSLPGVIAIVLMIISYAIVKINRDIHVNDISIGSLLIMYSSVFALSALMFFDKILELSPIFRLMFVILIAVEILTGIGIFYRYKILSFFKNRKKKRVQFEDNTRSKR